MSITTLNELSSYTDQELKDLENLVAVEKAIRAARTGLPEKKEIGIIGGAFMGFEGASIFADTPEFELKVAPRDLGKEWVKITYEDLHEDLHEDIPSKSHKPLFGKDPNKVFGKKKKGYKK